MQVANDVGGEVDAEPNENASAGTIMNTSTAVIASMVLVVGLSVFALAMMPALALAVVRLDARAVARQMVPLSVFLMATAVVAALIGALVDPLDFLTR
ncbi:hypothetical protein ACWPKO_29885 (plasmid) [Coraliomargarita sp. W4R53]